MSTLLETFIRTSKLIPELADLEWCFVQSGVETSRAEAAIIGVCVRWLLRQRGTWLELSRDYPAPFIVSVVKDGPVGPGRLTELENASLPLALLLAIEAVQSSKGKP